jgi:ParB family chromosome partitioning protein
MAEKKSGIAQFSHGRTDIHKVDPRDLVLPDGWNTRDETDELNAHIDMLAQSIAEIGVRKPIEVKLENGKLVVKDGFCRTRATMRAIKVYNADIKTVPVVSVDRYASDEDLILNQIISNSGKALTTMEQAKVFKKLLDLGWKQGDIAKKVGMSNGRISQILDLLTMPAQVQAMVSAGSVSPSLAQATVKAAETPAQATVALQAAVDKASSEGRKVKPADTTITPRKTIKDCFDNSEIDSENSNETGYVDIRMTLEDFEWLRDLLKL